jgi:sugar/nucleoside kinase (ribokinase family)
MKNKLMIYFYAAASSLLAQKQVSFTTAAGPDAVYQAVLNQLKIDGLELDSASVDAGIQTALVVTGKYRQTGTYSKISFIPVGGQTELRISVYEEKRYKALKIEPWSEPKLNEERSQAFAFRLKQELGW